MTKKKVAIIHFHPVEYYPPIHNLLTYISDNQKNVYIYFYSTKNEKGLNKVNYNITKDFRITKIKQNSNRLLRFLKYIYFNIFTIFSILRIRPDSILYVESISSFPAYLVSKFFFKKTQILIHYHEYTTPEQYQNDMKIVRYLHKKETFLYRKAIWLSQTNSDRLKLFKSNFPEVNFHDTLKTLPNFPPKKWKNNNKECKQRQINFPIKLVYIGSLAKGNMYSEELLNWVKKQKGKITLDLYAINFHADIIDFLQTLNCNYIEFKGGLNYQEIPMVLPKYDVGIIMYKAVTPNVKYCASNKLFEYLACDLDVWVSKEMVSSSPYVRTNYYPKVLKVDFSDLNNFDWKKAIDRKGLEYKPTNYFCENVLPKLTAKLY